jgi:hypothetical protein
MPFETRILNGTETSVNHPVNRDGLGVLKPLCWTQDFLELQNLCDKRETKASEVMTIRKVSVQERRH